MLSLAKLLAGLEGARVVGQTDGEIHDVRDDSRLVVPGDLFVAVPGAKDDGRRYVDQAIERGAVAIVTEGDGAEIAGRAIVIQVPSARRAIGVIAANRFAAAESLSLSAVTGTNGKTTTTYLLESILSAAGRRPGVIGTVTYRFGGVAQAAPLTTPGALALHEKFSEMKRAGATDVVLEASSHALDQGRLAGCRFRVAALTNVTQDHLDYHQTMDKYFAAKAILFRELVAPGVGVAVLFSDQPAGQAMRKQVRGAVLMAALDDPTADVAVQSRRLDGTGIHAELRTPMGPIEIHSPLVGEYNLANVVTAVAMAVAQGISASAIAQGVANLAGVPGRLERVANRAGVLCVVDYAHTPDAIERAIAALRPLTERRLIVVFGCGGDRDPGKRPLMGEAAARLGDVVVVTSDNPRTEDPQAILGMILPGVERGGARERSLDAILRGERGYLVESDRRKAIAAAVRVARAGDTVLIAGKGHEDYQIVGATKIHFDDREEAAAAFVTQEAGA